MAKVEKGKVSITKTFNATVLSNHPPKVVSQIPAHSTSDLENRVNFDLSEYISDEDDDELSFEASSDDETLETGKSVKYGYQQFVRI